MCRRWIILGCLLVLSFTSKAGDTRIASLRGSWKFALGFKNEWIKPEYNDADWDEVFAPKNWEDQGFYGYDGYACYRKKLVIKDFPENRDLILSLGRIDDCDEVYFNGKLVGFSGTFPPDFSTAYNVYRKYVIPAQYVNIGRYNTIVVKVYDGEREGGIVDGDIGLFLGEQKPPFEVDLSGMWRFKVGDKADYKKPTFDDSRWNKQYVPKYWEEQGYKDYDGFAWYRRTFVVSENLANDRVVIVLGKIDDQDEVYLNGSYIGTPRTLISMDAGTRYGQLRVYYIDGNLLIPNKENTIAVRVYDSGGGGGIYEGPVGIMKQKAFVQFWRNKK